MSEQPSYEPTRNGSITPAWWNLTRRIVTFLLGVLCVLWALLTKGQNVGILACGLCLIGVLPVENWLSIRR